MSRPVRIRGFLAGEVEAAALSERRSFANMVEVLLLAALEGRAPVRGGGVEAVRPAAVAAAVDPDAGVRPSSAVQAGVHDVRMPRAHMRADRPATECATRVLAGTTCPDCGKMIT